MSTPAIQEFDVAIREVVQETPMDRTIVLPIPAGAEAAFRFVPGQFVTLTDPEDDVKPPRKRPYSISSGPADLGRVEVTVRDSGSFGGRLYRMSAGKVLHVISPRGKFTLDDVVTDDLVLAAGGSGVAPFRSYVRHLRAIGHARPVTLLYSARIPTDLVFDAEWKRHARECSWFRYAPAVTRLPEGESFEGHRGRISPELLSRFVRDPATTTLYACGPNAFVDAAIALGAAAGLHPPRLRKEKWG